LSKTYLVTEADYTCTCSTQPRSTLGGECRCRRRQRICRDFVAVSADTVAGWVVPDCALAAGRCVVPTRAGA